MPRRERLTEKLVKAAAPAADDFQIFDEELRGFALVVYPSGRKAFALSYRIHGRARRMVIGGWPDWSVVAARERAKLLRREIDAGTDPLAQRDDARAAPRFADLARRYLEEHVPKLAPRNGSDQASMIRQLFLPDWERKLVAEITPADVERLLTRIAEGRTRPRKEGSRRPARAAKPTPIRANRAGEVLRKMFSLAVAWKMRDDNPAQGFRRRIEVERERFLGPEEIERLAAALTASDDQRGASIVRLCLLTGARLGEVRTARFEQFNLDLGIWTKPAANTKQRRVHRLPISAEVAAIVRQCRAAVPPGSGWLFPGDVADSDQPVQDIRRFWASLLKEADIGDLRIHDLRHTFASLLASGGASLQMIGRLLGHTQTRTTLRYAHLADQPLRAGVDAVAALVKPRPRVVGGTEAS